MRAVKKELSDMGHQVTIPDSVEQEKNEEDASIKIENDLIRDCYEKIKASDCVLVINMEKNGIEGYVGGNTFLEMGFAHVLNKTLYIMNPLPKEVSYYQELIAMQPIVLSGNLKKIK